MLPNRNYSELVPHSGSEKARLLYALRGRQTNAFARHNQPFTQHARNPTCRQPESAEQLSSKLTENGSMSENQGHGYFALVAQEDRAAVS